MEHFQPSRGIKARIAKLFSSPIEIGEDEALLILQTLPADQIQPHITEALLTSNKKKYLMALLTKWDLSAEVQERAAEALLKLSLEANELLVLVRITWTAEEALRRINEMPFDHQLYLSAVKAARAPLGSIATNTLIERLLPDVIEPSEFATLISAARGTMRARVALKWANQTNDAGELLQISQKVNDNDSDALETLTPIFEKTLNVLPPDERLTSLGWENRRPGTQAANETFRTYCVNNLAGSDRQKIIGILRNSNPSVDEIEQILSTETDLTTRGKLGLEVIVRSLDDPFMLCLIAKKYSREVWGLQACIRLMSIRNMYQNREDWPTDQDIKNLIDLYPSKKEELEMLLPLDPNDAMGRIRDDAD